MDGVRNRNRANNAPPLAGAEPQFLPEHHRNLPKKLHKVGLLTSATAVGGLAEQLAVAAVSSSSSSRSLSRQAEDDVPVFQLRVVVFLLLVTLLGSLGTIYTGCRLEEVEAAVVPTPTTRRWRKAGFAVYLLCWLLLFAAAGLVGSHYCELALNFIDV